jgi:NAD(P)-dependent dehydrogenase (short-subunit alcohol dehydrogenase family)
VFAPKPFLEHTAADYDSYADLNKATFLITQTVAQNMVNGGRGGAIVNIGSMWAKQAIGATPSSAYSMAKAGLHALTQHLALELAAHQIRVNAVSPAVVATSIYEGFIPPAEVDTVLAGFGPFHPLNRIGTSETAGESVTRVPRFHRNLARRGCVKGGGRTDSEGRGPPSGGPPPVHGGSDGIARGGPSQW